MEYWPAGRIDTGFALEIKLLLTSKALLQISSTTTGIQKIAHCHTLFPKLKSTSDAVLYKVMLF